MDVIFEIQRQKAGFTPKIRRYYLQVDSSSTILDCLNQIKWEQDGSLAFRKNCRNTICGSCAIRINGRSALACKENVGQEIKQFGLNNGDKIPTITIAPLGNLPVIKDLVVDMDSFWQHLAAVKPYVERSEGIPEKEFIQSPEEREELNPMGNCILCGACYSECNALEVNPDFVGPHALTKAARLLIDSRDDRQTSRLDHYNQENSGVWGCTRCGFCDAVCPMEVSPLEQIGKIKQQILQQTNNHEQRSVRHRQVLINLVKDGGWIDERQFGLQVVGNYLRDLRGLMSLGPLGLRMISRQKFPTHFEPSTETTTIRQLIESIQNIDDRE